VSTDSSAELALVCPDCGYSLHGIESDRCPECGLTIDRTTLSISRLPWAHRDELGRFRAYWRTVLMAMFRPRLIGQEMNRPVSFSDSQRFRHATVLLGFVPLLAWGVGLFLNAVNFSDLGHGSCLGWVLQGIDCLAVAFAGWLLLFMMSGSASYFYHPRSLGIVRQNRAVALSYYSCAPLAWMFVPAILFGIAVGLESIRDPFIERFSNSFLVLAGGAGTAILSLVGDPHPADHALHAPLRVEA